MQHAKAAAVAAGVGTLLGILSPWLGGVGTDWSVWIETPYGEVAAALGVLIALVAGVGGVRGWRGGAVLTLGFGVLATPVPVLLGTLEPGLSAEVIACLLGGALAIAAGAYGAGVASVAPDPREAPTFEQTASESGD